MSPQMKRKRSLTPSTKAKKARGSDGHGQQPANPTTGLLQLPRELRDAMWVYLFSSTRLTFSTCRAYRQWKPAPNSLALLRTCTQIYEETKNLWLGYVLFNFHDGETLLDKLDPLPLSVLSQIRHIRLCSSLMKLEVNNYIPAMIKPVALFMLLPGLQLDTFTVQSR